MRKPPCWGRSGFQCSWCPSANHMVLSDFKSTRSRDKQCHALMSDFSTVQFRTQNAPSLLLKRWYPRVPHTRPPSRPPGLWTSAPAPGAFCPEEELGTAVMSTSVEPHSYLTNVLPNWHLLSKVRARKMPCLSPRWEAEGCAGVCLKHVQKGFTLQEVKQYFKSQMICGNGGVHLTCRQIKKICRLNFLKNN